MDRDLEYAREELELAADRATGTVETRLQSVGDGIYEEESGEHTRSEPGPKVDRIAEMDETLADLDARADDAEVRERVATAREALRTYRKTHPDAN